MNIVKQKPIKYKLANTNDKLSAMGGISLVSDYINVLKLKESIDKHMPSPLSNRGYKPSTYVIPMIDMLISGGKHLEDINKLKTEHEIMALIGEDQIASSDAYGDWLRRMGDPNNYDNGLKGLEKINRELIKKSMKRDEISEYTLDVDATEIIAEKFEAKYTYNKNKGYMPVVGFLYENELCIYDEFRDGNVSPNTNQLEFYRQCKKQMPIGKKIVRYRADGAHYIAELINELEEDNVKFAIRAHKDDAIMREIKKIEKDNAIATNYTKEEKSMYEVLKFYDQRGQTENFIKELKNGFGMHQMPCGQTYANAVFFRIGVLAYNIFIGLRNIIYPHNPFKQTIETMRFKIINVAGKIVTHSRQFILKIYGGIKLLETFIDIRNKIQNFKESFA